jgi:malate dehydrogenase
MKKISIIGAGNVGATAAFIIANKELSDVVMVDIIPDMPQGKGLDMAEASPIQQYDSQIIGTNDYTDIADSDIVIVTSGLPRKPGMSREDLLQKNAEIVGGVTEQIVKYAPNSVIILVTNPLDIMTYHAWKVSGFSANQVVGQAGILDSARFRYFIAEALNVSIEDISAMVLGGHGDTMLPLPRYTTVAGIPITELMSEETISQLSERTRNGGGEIVNLLKTGSAFYAPGAAVAQMAEAIIKDKKRILPCSAYLTGQYGINDVYIGVPVKLGADGVEEIIELRLTDSELAALQKSANIYREGISLLGY